MWTVELRVVFFVLPACPQADCLGARLRLDSRVVCAGQWQIRLGAMAGDAHGDLEACVLPVVVRARSAREALETGECALDRSIVELAGGRGAPVRVPVLAEAGDARRLVI